MIIAAIISTIVDAVIRHAFEQESDKLSNKIRNMLGRDPVKKAFNDALHQAFVNLEQQHPQWVANNFDISFFAHEGASILSQFLLMNGRPDPSELAERWANSLNIRDQQRTHYVSELEPIATDFLHNLTQQLKKQEALRDLNESRALDQIAEDIQAVRQHLGAEKATVGTQQDYLRWLIDRNFYLDPSGTFQTQRQIQLKLDEIYISLQAQPSEALNSIDLHALEEEISGIEVEANHFQLTAVEREDRRDLLQKLLESRPERNKSAEILELAEVVNRYDRVVILGDPGSGKTTLLRYLALQYALALRDRQKEAKEGLGKIRFPLLIRIAEYAENGIWKQQSLSDFLPSCCTTHDCPKRGLTDLLQNELEKGECLILLDGLDEIVSADERSGVVKQIEDFVLRYSHKDNRFVITSRIAGYSSAPLSGPFTHYTVREMDDKQIRHFLERWCQAVEDTQTPEISAQERTSTALREVHGILQAIQNPGVHRLAVNPLLLRILALIHRTGAKLPQKRIELYKLATDTLARTWRPSQGVATAKLYEASALLKEDYLTPLLSELAYWLHTHKPTGIATEREVYEVLGEAWARINEWHWDPDNPQPHIQEEIRRFLLAVHTHTGLFVERAPKRYGFLHLTFEEYYVARYLVASSRKRAKLIRQHLHLPRWEEPLLLAIGFVGLDYPKESSELVEEAILAQGELAKEQGFAPSLLEDLLGQDYLFALRCLSDSIPVRQGLINQLIKRLVDECFKGGGLARFSRYKRTVNTMLVQLSDSDYTLSLVRHLSPLLQDSQIETQMCALAAISLGRMANASPEAIAVLLAVLQDSQVETQVRANIALTLGGIRSASSLEIFPILLTVLQDSQVETQVRASAASALGQMANTSPEVTKVLLTILQDSQIETQVRANIALSLGGIRSASSLEIFPILLTFLQDSQGAHTSFFNTANLLGMLVNTPPEVTEILLTVLQDSQVETQVRASAASALGQMANTSPEVTEILLTILQDSQVETQVRASAASALGQLDQPKLARSADITDTLCSLFQKAKNWGVRRDIAQILGRLNQIGDTVLATLWQGLLDTDNDVREACALSLAQIGRKHSMLRSSIEKKLSEIVYDPKFEVRDDVEKRPAYDYAYEGLWSLVVSSEQSDLERS